MTDVTQRVQTGEEPEFYVEPAELRGKEIAGVILALLALALIGISGYIWLNPDLSYRDIRSVLKLSRAEAPAADGQLAVTDAPDSGGGGADELKRTTPAMDSSACPYCGMFTAPSESHIKVNWSNGSQSDHDCWDCAFGWARQEGLGIELARVRRYGSSQESPEWLDATKAIYLYDVRKIKGSMPPFIAAFADRAGAEGAKPKLGGEVLDWAALQARFEAAP